MSNNNNRQSTLSDLDDLLKELDSVEQTGRSSVRMKASTKQRDSSRDFDELEKLVAQFDEEKGKPSKPTPAPTPPPAQTQNPPAPKPAPISPPTQTQNPKPVQTTQNPKPAPSFSTEYETMPPPQNQNPPAPSNKIMDNKRTSVFHREPPLANQQNICPTCGQPVEGAHILALGKLFHPNHLNCSNCGVDIRGDFYDQDGTYLCKSCVASRYPCSVCGRPIEKEYLLGEGKFYHPTCIDRNYCDRCNQEIPPTTRKLSALGKHWHDKCFLCTGCSSPLDTTFFAKNNQPYCSNCSQTAVGSSTRCSECGQDVAPGTTFVSYAGRSYHQKCFKCFKCQVQLNHEQFYNVNGTTQCQNCAMNS
jgi:paxillin